MHNAALAAAGLGDWHYQHLPIPPERFAETVLALPRFGFAGINVTIPHKQAALALAGRATARAAAIGAANTLSFAPDGTITADNTDAPGLLAALDEPLAGRSALVLGAGGSARAAVWALLDAGAGPVLVWNRTPQRARVLTAELGGEAVVRPVAADVVVNCTSVGLAPASFKELPLPADLLGKSAIVVDLVYRPGGTALLHEAQRRGCRTVSGLEILVRQGALSFEAWTGLEAPLAVMRAAVAEARPGDPAEAGLDGHRTRSPNTGAGGVI